MKLKITVILFAALLGLQAYSSVPKGTTARAIADALAEKVLPGDASLMSYTSVLKAVEQADMRADESWRKLRTQEEYDTMRARIRARMVEAVGGFPARTPLNA
jgi:ornithine carbamoyltransferase